MTSFPTLEIAVSPTATNPQPPSPHTSFSRYLLLTPALGLDRCPASDLLCCRLLDMMFWDPALIISRSCASSDRRSISGCSFGRYGDLASGISLLGAARGGLGAFASFPTTTLVRE